MKGNKLRIAVGLSGGVDSTVVAALLKEQGHEVIGVTMQLCDSHNPHSGQGCFCISQLDEIDTAKRIADQLGIEHHVIDCSKEYSNVILNYFRREYKLGHTPNPCVVCNEKFKFGLFLDLVEKKIGKFDKFATGHYAHVSYSPDGFYVLNKARCKEKDQTYFLSRLSQKQLSKVMFPLGDFESKEIVREYAKRYNLETATKKDSQDFYSGNKIELISPTSDVTVGYVTNTNGDIIGHHAGYWKYTVGQRRGFSCRSSEPMYVLKIIPETNTLIVGTRKEAFTSSFKLKDIVWLMNDPCMSITVDVKIRSSGKNTYRCSLDMDGNITCLNNIKMFGVTSGQFAVLYSTDMVVGSGVIV